MIAAQGDGPPLGGEVRVGYTRNEIVWLRSLSHEEAIALDEHVVSSVYHPAMAASAEDAALPITVRWHEVRVAERRALIERRDREIFARRCDGATEQAVADEVGLDRSTVNRRFSEAIGRIQATLGGPPAFRQPAFSTPPTCINCGVRPRARAQALRTDRRGFWRVVEPEREIALCAACLPVESRGKLLLRLQDLSHLHKAAGSVS